MGSMGSAEPLIFSVIQLTSVILVLRLGNFGVRFR